MNKLVEQINQCTEISVQNALTENYMPYAMIVVISRAIPLVYDGLKPSHRKLLYMMYSMGLLHSSRTKCANIVGQTMKLNPHGDAAIYKTLVRLTKDNASLLVPLIDSKGNFGKVYSRDMAFAASRYTEAKLEEITNEIFKGIDNIVDFRPNYDGKMLEPTVLPARFPNILCNPNQGIAVGMASNICSFNLIEVCEETIKLLNDESSDIYLLPDFSTGGDYILDDEQIDLIMKTGKGNLKVRASYEYEKKENCITITEIPYTTTVEAIIDKISDLVKIGKIKEISNILDSTDLSGMKIDIYLKRGVDPEQLMQKLYKTTPLEDIFSCNFNVLVKTSSGELTPKVLGAKDILLEWINFRISTLKRELNYELDVANKKIHLLRGLEIVAIDLDKVIEIIRKSKTKKIALSSIMDYFNLTEEQAESIGKISLIDLNEDYFAKQLKELSSLQKSAKKLEKTLNSDLMIKQIIKEELLNIKEKYGTPRKTKIINETIIPVNQNIIVEESCSIVVTNEFYVKLNNRYNASQRLKDGDGILMNTQTTTLSTLLVFTDKLNCYKVYLSDLEYTVPSALGSVLRHIIGLNDSETIVSIQLADKDYSGILLNVYKNGKLGKIETALFKTEQKRTCLKNSLGKSSPLKEQFLLTQDEDLLIQTSSDKIAIINSSEIDLKQSRGTIGENVINLSKNEKLKKVIPLQNLDISTIQDIEYYRISKGDSAKPIKKGDSFPFLSIKKSKKEQLALEIF